MRRTSIGSWAYNVGRYEKSPVPFDTVLGRLSELGFDGVELGAFNSYPTPHNHPTPGSRAALKEKIENHGLAISGLSAGSYSGHLLNLEKPDAYHAEFDANLDFAADLGIKGIRLDCVQPPTIHDEVPYQILFDRLTTAWSRCIDRAGERGLYVTWEFEPGFAFNKPSDIEAILDALPQSNFGVMYDTCHAQLVAVVGSRHHGEQEVLPGGQLELIKRLSGRINHIHLIDSDNKLHRDEQGNEETSSHPPFGEGLLDFDSIVPALAKEDIGHDWWTVDLCFWPDAWEATAKCKAAIDELNRKYG